ncbi:probable low affinity copper uptake protein 2 [Aplysia californica]|uniref:Copper transport protein n=1 Tax=Aplysia californica TaxID=6500 RepID=A0ABM0JU51_APLCA|nr:probable low affinity copper uptake protein 2 [Aplysia californica]XP_005101552.1 probable low affinity copper uptake protein 2 [Aplysia californica]XP_012939780.1 probable low affinity copper uptake protein 2 [Aplysia californica]XP_012939781.1 probable low affinity copper uptake protein 2 [Aplysia californica]
MHKTTFHTSTGDVLFFPEWVLHGRKETYLTCIVLVILGVCYQAIKFARQQYGRKCKNLECKRYILNKGHMLQTLMYLLQFVWGYVIMLSVMTFNVWILVAVLVGFGIGYFFFGWGEYEEPSAAMRVYRVPVTKSYIANSCSDRVTASSSMTQELLPLSESTDETIFRESRSDSVLCSCDNSNI